MKHLLSVSIALIASLLTYAQCDTLMIPESGYSLVSTSSNNGSNTGNLTFDNDNGTRWRTDGSGPHEIIIDLGASYDVTGMSIRTRWSGSGKVSNYEVYVSNTNGSWGKGERFDQAWYPNVSEEDTNYFGAVNGRYVRLVCQSTRGALQISELRFYHNNCAANGKLNQPLDFQSISKKSTTDGPITLSAFSPGGSGTVSYAVVSGPATVSGSTLTLTKAAGTVRVRALISETATHHAGTRDIEFPVIDLSTYNPTVSTRLTEDYPIELEELGLYYPIYVKGEIDEPDFLSINKVEIEIDGKTYTAGNGDGVHYLAWKPEAFKTYVINITATGSNGNTASITKNIKVQKGASTQTVTTLKDVVIEFGKQNSRDYYGTYTLPQFTGTYNQIVANFEVECPNGNCDDWDRWAYIDIKAPDGDWVQIIRYITPYNVACNHSIDLTDYASILQGEFEMHVFIDTWGTGGWQLTLDLDYTSGKPIHPYSTLTEVWDGTFDFGNIENLESVPDKRVNIPEGTKAAKLILSSTGHGWGANNTGNAAEFYHARHDVMVDGNKEYEQDLWNDCDPNPDNCLNQQGTWRFNRAGWCPGAIAPPHVVDLKNHVSKSSVEFGYKFQSNYRDLCHPKNPNCVTGTTCTDCNAGYNPHYQVDVQMVTFSDKPLVFGESKEPVKGGGNIASVEDIRGFDSRYNFVLFPNPNSGKFNVQAENLETDINGVIFSIDGTQYKRYYFDTVTDLEEFEFNIEDLESGVYFLQLSNAQGKGTVRFVLN